MPANFADRLNAAVAARGTPAVVGIDPVLERLPAALRPRDGTADAAAKALEAFSRTVIDRVAPHVPAVKINSAFFEAFYEFGVAAYYRLVAHAHSRGLLVIGDVKRGDIGSTAALYARGHLAPPTASDINADRIPDAVTLAGYLGRNAVAPFVAAGAPAGRGVYVLVRPSDPGADEVHEFAGASAVGGAERVGPASLPAAGRPPAPAPQPPSAGTEARPIHGASRFYEHMAALVASWGAAAELRGTGGWSCVGAVVAPKDVASTAALRAALPHTPFLVPGYGAQGAAADACRACFRADGTGAVINASRSVIFAYEEERWRAQHGDDWAACIAAAAQQFAREAAALAR